VRKDAGYFIVTHDSRGQKGRVEKRHAELRYILPKEKSFQSMELTSQKALNLVLSHLNSYPSKQYGGRTPFEMLRFTYPELLERLSSFGIREIPKDNVVFTSEPA
jgi:IS30 family transposase